MDLKLKEVAEYLKVSEKTVYRWVKSGQIPFFRVNKQFRFNKDDLDRWAMDKRGAGIVIDSTEPNASDESSRPIDIVELTRRGGIHYRLEGTTPDALIRECASVIRFPGGADKARVERSLLEREAMAPTTIGGGVAVPHPRQPSLSSIDQEFAAICFTDTPVDFKSLDNELVHTVITLVCANTARHLRALAEVSAMCANESVLDCFRKRERRTTIMAEIEKHARQRNSGERKERV